MFAGRGRDEVGEGTAIETGIRWRRIAGMAMVVALAVVGGGIARPCVSAALAGQAGAFGCTAAPATSSAPPVVGYAGLPGAFPFLQDVSGGVARAAACAGVELVVVDNGYDPDGAAAAAEAPVRRGVDVAIVVQTDDDAAAATCAPFEAAGVPVVAVGAALPCAVVLDLDDTRAGRLAGVRLAGLAAERWGGAADALVVLEPPAASPLPLAGTGAAERAEGAVAGARAGLPGLAEGDIERAETDGTAEGGRAAMADVLGRLDRSDRILVAAMTDPIAAGALRAVEAAGRGDRVLVAGQGATIEARDELCAGTPAFAGSVAFFPERYGDRLIPLAVDLAAGAVPPTGTTTDHVWIDAGNVGRYYPGECEAAAVPMLAS